MLVCLMALILHPTITPVPIDNKSIVTIPAAAVIQFSPHCYCLRVHIINDGSEGLKY